MNIKQLLLYEFLLLLIIGITFSFWFLKTQYPDIELKNESLLSTINTIGSTIAITAGLVISLQKYKHENWKMLILATGLLSMGIIQIFQSISTNDIRFISFQSAKTLIGACCFILIWLPETERYLLQIKTLPVITVVISIIFGLSFSLFPEWELISISQNTSLISITATNIVSSVMFLAASINFLKDFHSSKKNTYYLLSLISTLIILSNLMFPYSTQWTFTWWFLNYLQLVAYLIAGFLVAIFYYEISKDVKFLLAEHENLEDKLYESKEWAHLVIDSANDPFISINSKGIIMEWNNKAVETFGWSKEEVIGQGVSELIIPQQLREVYNRAFNNYLKTGEGALFNKRIEITAFHHDGYELPIEITIHPILLRGIVTFNAFVHDISEYINIEKFLKESKTQYEHLISHPYYMVRLYKSDGTCIYTSPGCQMLLGYLQEDLLGHSKYEFVYSEDIVKLKEYFSKTLNSIESHTITYRHTCKDGNYIWLEETIQSLEDSPKKGQKQIISTAHKINPKDSLISKEITKKL